MIFAPYEFALDHEDFFIFIYFFYRFNIYKYHFIYDIIGTLDKILFKIFKIYKKKFEKVNALSSYKCLLI